MKNNIYKIALFVAIFFGMSSCNYLDIVPDNTPDVDDAFGRPSDARKFLYSMYSLLPKENDMFTSPTLWGTDEIVTPWDRSWYYAKRMIRGEMNSSTPFFDYWTPNGEPSYYDGIRQTFLFLNYIDNTPGFSAAEMNQMKGEAEFLIGYFHFLLMRQYGPVVIVDGVVDISGSDDVLFKPRATYQECVQFVIDRMDKSIALLPSTVAPSEYGRVTKAVAAGMKAKVLLYAASPLFNGNSSYSSFVDKEGKQLIDPNYDPNKWKAAADAYEQAIFEAHSVGASLFKDFSTGNSFEDAIMNVKYSMVEPWNSELVWGYSNPEQYYGWQRHCAPAVGNNVSYGGTGPTMKNVKSYLTKNGLPLSVDPLTKNQDLFSIAPGDSTILLNRNREPRFYANVAFDRGSYYMNGTKITMYFRAGEKFAFDGNFGSPTGYLVQKGVHPATLFTPAQDNVIKYPWPIMKLSELYLSYAEALNEYAGPTQDVLDYVNMVRTRAGIPTVENSWSLVGKSSFTKEEMREIIRNERNIELAYEGHRAWDIRRWKIGNEFNHNVNGLKTSGATAADFYQEVTVEQRVFPNSYYLFPIRLSEVQNNPKLVNNPGW